MSALRSLPLLAIVVAIYNLVALASADLLEAPLISLGLLSGAVWTMSVGHSLLAMGLILLYAEVVKATRTTNGSTMDHLLSMLVFVVCLLEFVSLRPFGTPIFFLIMLMTFVDVVAGFTVGIRSARRDIDIDR